MAKETHIIDIAPDGKTVITVKGLKGRKCSEATHEIQKALGRTVSDVPTEEMYERENTTQHKQ